MTTTGTPPLKKVPIHLQSASNRILIKNGTVVNADDEPVSADVYIEDAKIKMVGIHLIIPGGTRVIDAAGKFVIPGGIDSSVRLQKPYPKGSTVSIDDFYRGTRAALVGGTTTVVDCVAPESGESLIDAYNKWRGWAEDKVCCNYALRCEIGPETPKQEIADLTHEDFGVNTFRLNMCGGEKRFSSDADILDAFETVKAVGGVAQVHAESGDVIEREERAMIGRGITGPEGYAMSHSEMAEEEAAMRASTLANQTMCPVYLGPLTSPAAAEVVASKKARGAVVYAETSAAAVILDGEEYWNQCWRHAASFLSSPPLRKGAADAMAKCAAEALDSVCSDHCTFNAKQKALGQDDFRLIPAGVNGAEERMSVVWERCGGAGDPARFVALTSANAAKIFNMYPRKGRIEVGAEADVVVWNPNAAKKITKDEHQSKVDFNVFEGKTVHGVAEHVICQGKVMIDEGHIRVMQGFGRFEPLAPFCPHVYSAVKAREEADAAPRGIERSEEDMAITNGGSEGEIPPMHKPPSNQAEPAPSQHTSNFDLRSHPNAGEEVTQQQQLQPAQIIRSPPVSAAPVQVSPAQDSSGTTVRVMQPPGGKSSGGFW